MTSIRSNHDIKFIPSGKDGKSCVFYMTDYATKSQLSTHQMLPLIAASKKVVQSCNAQDDLVKRSKSLITKCLNRITTETEISGSHVSHFLLGHSDKKTSHSFVRLNLHSALAWVNEEMRKYDVNQLIDYINRGHCLSEMAFYEYCSKVYKATLSNEERRKLSKNKSSVVERGRRPQPRYLFIDGHPQTETHLQIVRAEPIVPSLSFFTTK